MLNVRLILPLTIWALVGPSVGTARAQVTEFFDRGAFAATAGALTVVDFDSQASDAVLTGNEYAAQGVTISTTGGPINIVQNLATGCYGNNYVTEANLNSSPNGISTSIAAGSASPDIVDEFDFVLNPPASAAGLFIGNLGNGSSTFLPTLVTFFDEFGNEIVTPSLGILHDNSPNVISGSACGGGLKWDNRIFYGIVSTVPIKTIKVRNGPYDGDGIAIDDVQFGRPALTTRIADLAALIRSSHLAFFTGPNLNANAGRRESLATRADEASDALALGDTQGALEALRNLLSKIDGVGAPPDWMMPSDRTGMIAAAVQSLIGEIEALP